MALSFPVRPLRASDPAEGDATLVRRLAEQGYLFLPGLLDPALPAALGDAARSWLHAEHWLAADGAARVGTPAYDDPAFVRLQQHLFPHPAMTDLRRALRSLPLLAAVVGGHPADRLGDLVRVRCAGACTRPHQDQHYLGGETERWTAWLPLAPCPLAAGPLAVLPGSHHLGPLDHAGPPAAEAGVLDLPDGTWRASPVGLGDVLLFPASTLHRSLPTTTARPRLSADLRFGPPSAALPEAP